MDRNSPKATHRGQHSFVVEQRVAHNVSRTGRIVR